MLKPEAPLAVRLAVSSEDLRAACGVRAEAYGHHDPGIGRQLGQLEPLDAAEGVAVLLCEERDTGRCVGTLRVQTSFHGPLLLERSLALPDWLAGRPRAQISRLAVTPGASAQVKLSLMRDSYQYCLAMGVRWMVIGARSPALIRGYRALGFVDVFADGGWRPLASAAGLPHRILALDVAHADDDWRATRNRLYGFMTARSADAAPQLGVQPARSLSDAG